MVLALSGAVIIKMGKNYNSTGITPTIIDDLIAQAESTVNGATRYNWNDAYAGLNVDVKRILSEAVSNLAAMYGITYDMSGYTSSEEARTMLDQLRDGALRAISILRDKQTETFIHGA